LALGAALWAYYNAHPDATINKLEHLYFGIGYSNDEIEKILKDRHLSYYYVEDIEKEVAKYLAENKIVAWFQGRMESGPRALGNRSILMSPMKAENKDIINARVKFREAFRPFCPSLIEEKKDEYLKNNRLEPFMITSFDVTDEKRDKIPAVVHVDGTLRPQTVSNNVNPRYWALINEFGKLTGEYILLNTSMNIAGEPIVCNPREAIRCFYDNGIDCLILENFILPIKIA
jgi:carbamoyltransferase